MAYDSSESTKERTFRLSISKKTIRYVLDKAPILESSKRNEDSHMMIKVNYQKTFQVKQVPSHKY